MAEIHNAQIKDADLLIEDHGILTGFVRVSTNGWTVSIGGYMLDTHDPDTKGRAHHGHCGLFIRRILETMGLTEWSNLIGRPCRVELDGNRVIALGHFMEDRWFRMEEEMQALNNKLKLTEK